MRRLYKSLDGHCREGSGNGSDDDDRESKDFAKSGQHHVTSAFHP